MEHVSGVTQITASEGHALASQLHLTQFDASTPSGLNRLARLATIYHQNPDIVNTHLDDQTRGLYFQVLHDHVHAFALSMDDLAQPSKAAPFRIHTFGAPSYRLPIRSSPTHTQHMREKFKELKRVGLVRSQSTPWASPCFCVPKPRSTKLRIVIDFRPLNLQTIRDSHPIPHARDIIQKLRACKVYMKLDLKSGFWQLPMHNDSVPMTGVCTVEDLLVWLRLPFGVRNGPPAFQRAILEALASHDLLDQVGCFIDDLATGGADHVHSADRVRALFKMMEDWHLLAGADKVFLG